MKCTACVKEGKRSRVYPEGTSVTLMSFSPYYDENGTYHSHDLNIHTTGYHCSNQHRWVEKATPECPGCGAGEN